MFPTGFWCSVGWCTCRRENVCIFRLERNRDLDTVTGLDPLRRAVTASSIDEAAKNAESHRVETYQSWKGSRTGRFRLGHVSLCEIQNGNLEYSGLCYIFVRGGRGDWTVVVVMPCYEANGEHAPPLCCEFGWIKFVQMVCRDLSKEVRLLYVLSMDQTDTAIYTKNGP